MTSLYARRNLIIRNFKHCSNDVKIRLFKTFCSNMYCGHLWSYYFSYSYSKIRVAFKQIYRCLMKLDRSSISQSRLIYDIDNFGIIIRKAGYKFTERLMKSENTVIGAIINAIFFQCSTTLRRWYTFFFKSSHSYTTIDDTFHVLMCKYVYISYHVLWNFIPK